MTDQTLTVSELGVLVRAALEQAMPYGVWVEGEIAGLKRGRNGHVYFDLTEPNDDTGGAPVATIPVTLFRDARDRVNRLLKRHGDPIRMTDGVRIRIQGMVDFYPPSGRVQLRMSAIDPTYTLGVLAAQRDALLRELTASGRLRANARHQVPDLPLRVGLVTSLGSAAHADVTTVFERSGRSFTVVEVDTAVQGAGAERALAAAIRTVGAAGVDVMLVVRGGGSKTDLAVFDHAEVAHAIVDAPVPVFTGIGHDIDRSVADEVAHTAHTTPTAAAQAVVALVDRWARRLDDHHEELARRADRALAAAGTRLAAGQARAGRSATAALLTADHRLTAASHRLRSDARRVEQVALTQLGRTHERLAVASRHGLHAAALRLDAAAARTRALDPAVALARGWSITRDADGRVVRSVHDVAVGAELVTQVADGTLSATITATDADPAAEDDR